jgi:2-dehydropantoate 2-reductase
MHGKTETYLLGESPHAKVIKEQGLSFQIDSGPSTSVKIAALSSNEIHSLKDQDLVLLAQKLRSLKVTATCLRSRCTDKTGIITLQNGIGPEQVLVETLGRPVDRGLIFFGANSPAPGEVRYFPGRIRLRRSPVTEGFALLMEGTRIPCEVSNDFAETEWMKLAINCVANPLAGILGANNRQLTHQILNPIKEAILTEIRKVALAEGVAMEMKVKDINKYLNQDNTPSLRTDLERKAVTEVDVLNGAVVRLGEKHGISTPANSLLLSLIKFLESR